VSRSATALNRFGLGARPDQTLADPRSWLQDQLAAPAPVPEVLAGLDTSSEVLREATGARQAGEDQARALRRTWRRERLPRERAARTLAAVRSESPFQERLVAFWSNHFTVSVARPEVVPLAGAFEREAIRPRVVGSFADLLVAVVQHPAMLLYLDNWRSTGPDSPLGRRRGIGLNENLAREILELHTLGVDGGYGQDDVEGLAGLLTGWGLGAETRAGFAFDERRHQPGPHVVLGVHYGSGEAEGERCLRDLAAHPSTAHHLSAKLARHFVSEDPAPDTLAALVRAWQGSRGDLGQISRALVELTEPWSGSARLWKTPWDLVVSTARALTWQASDAAPLVASMGLLGQALWAAPSPAGWSDNQAAWLGPDALLHRVEWAHEVATRVGGHRDPSGLARALLGDAVSTRTLQGLAGATSPVEGLTLVLASPEFQRR